MRVLLDTNIIIYREASRVPRKDIGVLFRWLDQLHYDKCVHPETIEEIRRHQDQAVVSAFEAKVQNYHQLKTLTPDTPEIDSLRTKYDHTSNDHIDTSILSEVYGGRVDALITEDRKIHQKAIELGIYERVFTIDAFLEKVTAENPDLADYRILSVKKEYFGNINVEDSFFDSFRDDYDGFNEWFNRKSDEITYLCISDKGEVVAFLYLKREGEDENYSDIDPVFRPAKRLKIGTFKVTSNGYKLGERFLKIIFDNALLFKVDEIYVTLFDRTFEHNSLTALLCDWGFKNHGLKRTKDGDEIVLVRGFSESANKNNPCLTYPHISRNTRKFIVPIYPDYHTELFPDSILKTESPLDFIDNRPNRNAISKVYISRSTERSMEAGDIIIFYRTASGGPAYYTSVATTIGVVQTVITNIASESQFIELCRKRSVFTDNELSKHWNYSRNNRPFIVNFLYVYSFPKRMNLKALIEAGIIQSTNDVPRGFSQINDSQFENLMEGSDAEQSLVID